MQRSTDWRRPRPTSKFLHLQLREDQGRGCRKYLKIQNTKKSVWNSVFKKWLYKQDHNNGNLNGRARVEGEKLTGLYLDKELQETNDCIEKNYFLPGMNPLVGCPIQWLVLKPHTQKQQKHTQRVLFIHWYIFMFVWCMCVCVTIIKWGYQFENGAVI